MPRLPDCKGEFFPTTNTELVKLCRKIELACTELEKLSVNVLACARKAYEQSLGFQNKTCGEFYRT